MRSKVDLRAEGAALGAALLERLAADPGPGAAALTVATTHMSALTGLKFEHFGGKFENASAEFDDESLAPTYRLLWGVPGRSNALNIAARCGLPEEPVAAARALLGAERARPGAALIALVPGWVCAGAAR